MRAKTIFISTILLTSFFFFISCGNDDTIENPNSNNNTLNKVGSIRSFSGIGKIKLTWNQFSDSEIQNTIIYWNNRRDSIIKEFKHITSGEQKDSIVIKNLREDAYYFEFKNINNKNESSDYSGILAKVWGEKFIKSLQSRIITDIVYDYKTSSFTLSLSPSKKDNNLLFSKIEYQNEQEVEKTSIVERDKNEVTLSDIPYGNKLKITSVHFFPDGLDTLYTEYITHEAISTYKNPIISRSLPDPTIIKADDGYFYVYATEDIRNTPIHKSKDLVNWEFIGTAFTEQTRPVFEPNGGLWAPEINFINGQYILYYSMSVWGGEWTAGIGAAIADKPEGPFINKGKLFRSNEIGVQNSIDQCYIEDSGKKYLFWGSFSGIYGIELSDDGLSVKEDAEKVQIAGRSYEAAFIHKTDNGYYYLFASIGSCCEGLNSTYTTVVGRSTNLFGPYVDKQGNEMMNNHHEIFIRRNEKFVGTGHNSQIVTDDNAQDWILYHAYQTIKPDDGRVLMMDQIHWDENDWPYIKGSTPSLEAERPFFNK